MVLKSYGKDSRSVWIGFFYRYFMPFIIIIINYLFIIYIIYHSCATNPSTFSAHLLWPGPELNPTCTVGRSDTWNAIPFALTRREAQPRQQADPSLPGSALGSAFYS